MKRLAARTWALVRWLLVPERLPAPPVEKHSRGGKPSFFRRLLASEELPREDSPPAARGSLAGVLLEREPLPQDEVGAESRGRGRRSFLNMLFSQEPLEPDGERD